jgi:hypothetical protein
MTDEQLDAALALIQRRESVAEAEVKWADDIDAVELELPAS